MIVIIDYNVGNLKSVLGAFKRIGLDAVVSRDEKIIKEAKGIVLPGVGTFPTAMKNLEKYHLVELLKERKEAIRKSSQRVFQALRIDVNNEFEVLYEFMEKLPGALKPGGRVAILTFHSGEDKLVKKALKAGYKEGIYSEYARDVVRPSAQECAQNGRASCRERV